MKKTYKRESAFAFGLVWAAVTVRVFWVDAPELVEAFAGPYGAMSFAVFTWMATAFGMDWHGKQSKWKEPGS